MDRYPPQKHGALNHRGHPDTPQDPHPACRAPQGAAGHRVVLHPQVRCSSLVTRARGAR